MNKVSEPGLKKLIGELYRPTATVGDGGSAAALVDEVRNGTKILRANGNLEFPHQQKVTSRIVEMRGLIKGGLSPSDERIARYLLNDLYNALKFAGIPIP